MAQPNPGADQPDRVNFLSPGVSIAQAEDPNRPRQVMGFRDLVLFYVITGISLRWIASAAAAGPSSIVIWVGAWLCFYTPLALSVLELSSRYPNEGGLYVWSKRAFGDFSGFMAGWTYWTSNLPYFPAVLYFAASNILFMRQAAWQHLSGNATFYIVFALLTLGAATLMNIVGLDVGKWLHNIGALAMWIPVCIVIVMGLVAWHRYGSATSFTVRSMTPSTHLNDIIFWSVLTFAFGGCETASFMGEEIKNAHRTIPIALLTGGVVVTICYILGTVCVLLALPSSEVNSLQGLVQAVSKTSARVGFPGVLPVAAFLIALSNIGAASAYLAAVARLPFVAGLDRFLPKEFGALHPRWKTPWVALLTQFVLGAIFIFLGQAGTSVKGAYDVLVSMGVITYFIPYLYLFAAMIKLQREPAGPEVIRVPGGKTAAKLVAIVGFVTTTVTIALSLIPQADEPNKPLALFKIVGATTALVLVGVWIYLAGKRRAAAMAQRET
ncbi:MAG TPA: APC family permease [Candidatus Sulfotelmatobacter sp.]|nr:APC family permease [Candidatus Sulfotelmatobacter sp.]